MNANVPCPRSVGEATPELDVQPVLTPEQRNRIELLLGKVATFAGVTR